MSRVLPYNAKQWEIPLLLSKKKIAARRVMKPQPLFYTGRKYIFADNECPEKWKGCDNIIDTYTYQPGDILYVRETWCKTDCFGLQNGYLYKATEPKKLDTFTECTGFVIKWRPSIHMPKAAARIWLKVTNVRIEQLQEIDDVGVVSEGLQIGDPFDELWDSTIKKSDREVYGWDANPWVWVIEFERCEKPESEK